MKLFGWLKQKKLAATIGLLAVLIVPGIVSGGVAHAIPATDTSCDIVAYNGNLCSVDLFYATAVQQCIPADNLTWSTSGFSCNAYATCSKQNAVYKYGNAGNICPGLWTARVKYIAATAATPGSGGLAASCSPGTTWDIATGSCITPATCSHATPTACTVAQCTSDIGRISYNGSPHCVARAPFVPVTASCSRATPTACPVAKCNTSVGGVISYNGTPNCIADPNGCNAAFLANCHDATLCKSLGGVYQYNGSVLSCTAVPTVGNGSDCSKGSACDLAGCTPTTYNPTTNSCPALTSDVPVAAPTATNDGSATCSGSNTVKCDATSCPLAAGTWDATKKVCVFTADPAATSGRCSTAQKCDLIATYINPLIQFLSALVGVAVTISIIIGGIQYGSSAGDPQRAGAAKTRIRSSLIALLTFLFLYAIINFLVPGGLFS